MFQKILLYTNLCVCAGKGWKPIFTVLLERTINLQFENLAEHWRLWFGNSMTRQSPWLAEQFNHLHTTTEFNVLNRFEQINACRYT